MPNIKSAAKRARQSVVRRDRNRKVKDSLKKQVKKTVSVLGAKNPEAAMQEYQELISQLDKAAKKGVIHINSANRRKSVYSRKILALKAAATAPVA